MSVDDTIQELKCKIHNLQLDLARLEDAKKYLVPKHGDIVDFDGVKRLIVKRENGDELLSYDENGCVVSFMVKERYQNRTYTVVGNVFDDENC